MKNILYIIVFSAILILSFQCNNEINNFVPSTGYIVANHDIMTKMYKGEIPLSDFKLAKEKLVISYTHTSHGGQLITGIDKYATWIKENSTIAPKLYKDTTDGYFKRDKSSNRDGKCLYLHENPQENISNDSSNIDRLFEIAKKETPKMNVYMISWCGQLNSLSEENVKKYLTKMNDLENKNPKIKFVYMTGHLSGEYSSDETPHHGKGKNSKVYKNNEIIREYCRKNNKVLYDFADIESYAMDYDTNPKNNINYMELNSNCSAWYEKKGNSNANFAIKWENENKNKYFTVHNKHSGHTQHMIYNQKAYAAWWLFTKIAKII